MSIPNLLWKIKGRVEIDHFLIFNIIVIILVGISAFGLGRLSVENNNKSNESVVIDANTSTSNVNTHPENNFINKNEIGKYVASKNGKLYYSANCVGVKRIKESNKIWFDTASEAEKLGYSLSPSCK